MKITLNEKDICLIYITDGAMTTEYEKYSKNDKAYVISYNYNNRAGEEYVGCCACCGHLFEEGELSDSDEPTSFRCPHCSNEYDTIIIPDMVDTVYSMIEDNCEVIIRLWDGEEYSFKLDEEEESSITTKTDDNKDV